MLGLKSIRYAFAMSKVITDPKKILSTIKPGSTILCGGFGLCGIPEHLIANLKELGTKDLTFVSNNAGQPSTHHIIRNR
jgi:acyl CoA:acetate/3-ketoacid CoA transferase alpha subunit